MNDQRLDLTKTDAVGLVFETGGRRATVQVVRNDNVTGSWVVAIYASNDGSNTDQRLWTMNEEGRSNPLQVASAPFIIVKVITAASTGSARVSVHFDQSDIEQKTDRVISGTINANSSSAVTWWPTNGARWGWFWADPGSTNWTAALLEVVVRSDESCDWFTPIPAATMIGIGDTTSQMTPRLDLLGYAQVGLRVATAEGSALTLTLGGVFSRLDS